MPPPTGRVLVGRCEAGQANHREAAQLPASSVPATVAGCRVHPDEGLPRRSKLQVCGLRLLPHTWASCFSNPRLSNSLDPAHRHLDVGGAGRADNVCSARCLPKINELATGSYTWSCGLAMEKHVVRLRVSKQTTRTASAIIRSFVRRSGVCLVRGEPCPARPAGSCGATCDALKGTQPSTLKCSEPKDRVNEQTSGNGRVRQWHRQSCQCGGPSYTSPPPWQMIGWMGRALVAVPLSGSIRRGCTGPTNMATNIRPAVPPASQAFSSVATVVACHFASSQSRTSHVASNVCVKDRAHKSTLPTCHANVQLSSLGP